MSTTPEQSQRITDLRVRMLQNIAAKKPAADGVTDEELNQALQMFSSNRAGTMERAIAKKAKAAKPSKAASDGAKNLMALLNNLETKTETNG